MITPELKSLWSSDLDRPALPPDPDDCIVAVQAEIGPMGEGGGEGFQFCVVTPKHLLHHPLPHWGRGFLIVESFSWEGAERAVLRLLDHARRASWQEVAEALGRDLDWEFHNYKPYES